MKFVKITTYYKGFLKQFYKKYPFIVKEPYQTQQKYLLSQQFGWSDFYSKHLGELGYEASEIITNAKHETDFLTTLKQAKPEIVFFEDTNYDIIKELKEIIPSIKLLIGWYNSPADTEIYKHFDLIMVGAECFKKIGKRVYVLPLAFEDSISYKNDESEDFVFFGSFYKGKERHDNRIEMVKKIDRLKIYGNTGGLVNTALSFSKYEKPLYGNEMFEQLAKAKIGFNIHIGMAEEACNMRMFETTGSGVCLVTDDLPNKYFAEDEVVTYKSAAECNEKVKYLLDHPKERRQIALRGQRRTLKDHTYKIRAAQLDEIIKENL